MQTMEAPAKVTVHSNDARVSTLPKSLSDDYRKKLGELIELLKLIRADLPPNRPG